MKRLSPKEATVITVVMSLLFSGSLFTAYSATHLWPFLALIAIYFAGTGWTLYLQLKNPASAMLMMRTFVGPSTVMFFVAWMCGLAIQGRLSDFFLSAHR